MCVYLLYSYSRVFTMVISLLVVYVCLFSEQLTLTNTDNSDNLENRLYIRNKDQRWPGATVYYDIDPTINYNYPIFMSIYLSVAYINTLSCVKWVQKMPWHEDVVNYVTFKVIPTLCASELNGFHNKGQQLVTLGERCFEVLKAPDTQIRLPTLHEMMHVLGLNHEHERPDRDCYIWVAPGYRKDWEKWSERKDPSTPMDYDKFPYDYKSITHFVGHYSIQNTFNITKARAYDTNIGTLGRVDGTLSPTDIWKIKYLYCGQDSYCKRYQIKCIKIRANQSKNPHCHEFD